MQAERGVIAEIHVAPGVTISFTPLQHLVMNISPPLSSAVAGIQQTSLILPPPQSPRLTAADLHFSGTLDS